MSLKFFPFLSLALATSYVSPLSIDRRTDHYVKLPVIHSTSHGYAKVYENKRDLTSVPLAKRSDIAYYARLNIGTPAQSVSVQLDTGSFELWVNPDCSNLQNFPDLDFCEAGGHYDPSSSSSVVKLPDEKNLTYGIGSASIRYVRDTVGLAGTDALLKDIQFGVAYETVDEFSGILGIGYGESMTIPYKNLIDQLADQGVTNTKAFSLALGSKREKEGVIIFGGLDTSKFSGNLQTLPIIPADSSPDGVPRYWINMVSLSISPPNEQTKQYPDASMPAFFDSGATLTMLPPSLVSAIAADFGAVATDSTGLYPVDCKFNDRPGTLDFTFASVTIRVPYREAVQKVDTVLGSKCYLGIAPSDDFVLLGDTFLRSAYAVFDQTNNAIHLAQYTNCGSKELEITTQMDWATIKGDCDTPDFGPYNETSSRVSDPPDSAAPRRGIWSLGPWAAFWAAICATDL
ncbi:aspartic peptidase domain-containing protein [Xylaria nigripes]|nr:aspartic peptidase domain-containing protein [Xylaria nigripes]